MFAVRYPPLIPCIPVFFCVPFPARMRGTGFSPQTPGILVTESRPLLCKETIGSPEFPSYPRRCMPWSQTPVVIQTLALTHSDLLPSGLPKAVGFTFITTKAIVETTNIDFSELNTEPASLIHLASDSRCRACPQISLLTCWLGFSQVGLELLRFAPTG